MTMVMMTMLIRYHCCMKVVTDTPDHVKNYRPKLLVLSGNPAHR